MQNYRNSFIFYLQPKSSGVTSACNLLGRSMRLRSKSLIKCCVFLCTAFQAFALYKGQAFSAGEYAGSIVALFGINSAHENVKQYLERGNGP